MALPLDYAFEVVDSRGDLADQSGMKTDFVLTITQVRKVELVRMSVVCLITPVQPDIYARVPSFLKLTYPSGDSVNAAIDPPGPNESIQNSTGLPFCTEDVPYSGRWRIYLNDGKIKFGLRRTYPLGYNPPGTGVFTVRYFVSLQFEVPDGL